MPSVSLSRDHIHRRLDRLLQAQSRNRQTAGLRPPSPESAYGFHLISSKCETGKQQSEQRFLQYFVEQLLCVKMSCLISKEFMVHNQSPDAVTRNISIGYHKSI